MSSLTFESLPDEILMIIFQYSGDVCNILRTFLGLNQRLNGILLDKRLHLLTDFLFIHPRNDYYNSKIFQQVSQQLSSTNTTINEEDLNQLLQPLISFHIRQRYTQLGQEFQSILSNFQSIRQQLTNDERLKVDHELKTQFNELHRISAIDNIKNITSLVLRKGARLVCDDYELGEFNLAKAINQQFLSHINDIESQNLPLINSSLRLFKTLIVSNTSLLANRDYVGNGGSNVEYFLVYTLGRLKYFYGFISSRPVNVECYRAILDLFLFMLQCYKLTLDTSNYIQRNMFEMLRSISKIHNDLYIRTAQFEILKIIVDQYDRKANQPWDDYLKDHFKDILKHLVQNRRFDVLKYVFSHCQFQEISNEPDYIRKCVNTITRDHVERRFFSMTLDNETLNLLFDKKYLIFILIDKKERTLLKKVLTLSSCLINQLDEDGNDLLLRLCLKVDGCRHRIIEMLIKMGSNLERRNFKGQNFMETLQMKRNEKLYQKLIEHEIIKLDI
jgi:hypothetical protein